MHADVIAGRQTNQTSDEIVNNFMKKYVNPSSNCSLATSCTKSVMASSECKVVALFTEGGRVQRRENWQSMRLHQR